MATAGKALVVDDDPDMRRLVGVVLEEDPKQIVILFSAYLDSQTIDRAHQLGTCAVLSKDEIRRLPGLIDGVLAS